MTGCIVTMLDTVDRNGICTSAAVHAVSASPNPRARAQQCMLCVPALEKATEFFPFPNSIVDCSTGTYSLEGKNRRPPLMTEPNRTRDSDTEDAVATPVPARTENFLSWILSIVTVTAILSAIALPRTVHQESSVFPRIVHQRSSVPSSDLTEDDRVPRTVFVQGGATAVSDLTTESARNQLDPPGTHAAQAFGRKRRRSSFW